ncbi:MAG: NlpC/P60 family protein [Marinilabiliaceae bacterium]
MAQSICSYGFIPVRSEPAESACLETQILFGETFEVLERQPPWCRIKCHFDDYEGWIDEKLVGKFDDQEVERWIGSEGIIVNQPFMNIVREEDNTLQILSAGSRIVFDRADRKSFSLGNEKYSVRDKLPGQSDSVIELAHGFMNAPYLWGGRSFYGIDCSGFVQVVYKAAGIFLPRNASQQVKYGETLSFVEEARPGDLAYFEDEEGHIVHVGICLGGGRILHASGSVHIDLLDHQGIYHLHRRVYTHHLRLIKRIHNG